MDTETLEEIKSWREMLEPFFNQLTRLLTTLDKLAEKEVEKVS